MKRLLPWAGVIAILGWLGTMFIALSMMWDPAWMSTETTPPLERATMVLHGICAVVGFIAGLSLLSRRVRSSLTGWQLSAYLLALVLALLTAVRWLA